MVGANDKPSGTRHFIQSPNSTTIRERSRSGLASPGDPVTGWSQMYYRCLARSLAPGSAALAASHEALIKRVADAETRLRRFQAAIEAGVDRWHVRRCLALRLALPAHRRRNPRHDRLAR